MRTTCFYLLPALAVFPFAAKWGIAASTVISPAQMPRSRAIYVLLDVTPSYKSLPDAVVKTRELVFAIGPADRFYLIEIGGEFSPKQNVKIQCKMPAVHPVILSPAKNVYEWKDRQSRLSGIWQNVGDMQQQIDEYLAQPIHHLDPTPLYETFKYAAERLEAEEDAERYLFVFSDYEQDSRGLKSKLPPQDSYALPGVDVFALFVPWDKDWEKRKLAWTTWYLQQCKAAHFKIFDDAQAKVSPLLAPNRFPKTLPGL
jgi:hypothetical protein